MNEMLRRDGKSVAQSQKTPAQGAKPLWAMSRREAEAELRAQAGLPPLRRKWPWILLLVVLIAAAGAAGWYLANRNTVADENVLAPAPAPEPAEIVKQLIPTEYTVIHATTLEQVTKVTGSLRPSHQALLSAEVGGLIEEVTVRPGDAVAEGDILVRIDVATLSSDLDLARMNAAATRVQMELAQSQLERAESLRDRGVTTNAALDEARTQVRSLRANLEAQEEQVRAAELRLEKATVRAPFDAVVSAREVEAGQYVGTGTPLVSLVDTSLIEMEAAAPAAAVSRIAPGNTVQVQVDGLRDRRFDGLVERINPVATQGTRTVPVYIEIENTDGTLTGGMFANGQIVTDSIQDALAVPLPALREDEAGHYVLKIVDGRATRVTVSPAGTWGRDLVRIAEGLAEGDVIVTAPLASLAAGDAVALIED